MPGPYPASISCFIPHLNSMKDQYKSSDTEELIEDLGESLGYVQAFVRQEVQAVKLEIAEKVSIASSNFITGLVITIFSALVIIFAGVSLGFFLGAWLESNALGFILVAFLFLVVLLVVYLFRKPLITDQVVAAVIHLFFDNERDETHKQPGRS